MRTKIKAENAEQLLEIIRAVQNGEEPEEALLRREAESAPEADSPKPHSGQRDRKPRTRREPKADAEEKTGAKKRAVLDLEEDVEESSETRTKKRSDENAEEVPEKRIRRGSDENTEEVEVPEKRIRRKAGKNAERYSETRTKQRSDENAEVAPKKRIKQEAEEYKKEFSETEAEQTPEEDEFKRNLGSDANTRIGKLSETDADKRKGKLLEADVDRPQGRLPETDADKRKGKLLETDVDRPQGKLSETDVDRLQERLPETGADRHKGGTSKAGTDARTGRKLEAAQNVLGAGVHRLSGFLAGLRNRKDDKTKQERKKGGLKAGAGKTAGEKYMSSDSVETEGSVSEKQEKTSDELVLERLLGRGRPGISAGESRDQAGFEEELEKKSGIKTARGRSGDGFSTFIRDLEQRGISRRELFMLGAGLIFVVMIVLFVVNGIRSFLEEKRKSEHVTADSGLVVTVESEPETWSNSYPVVLSFRAKGTSISKILIGDEEYIPDEKGQITVEASDYLLEAEVTTEKGMLTAQIEVPMLDAQAPSVNVAREDDLIKVMAADARSGVSGVWYASVRDNDFLGMPVYQKYSEPVRFETGTTYYFYAQDEAGNRSSILATTTEPASELTLQTNKLCCFPGETRYLPYQESPAGALLNNLRFESANTEVAVVDSTGAVTAMEEGTTVVTVSADGVAAASCTIEVSKERTVTISAIGDCTLGTDESFNTNTSFNAFDVVNGHAYFFRNVKEILENDDVTFANMEGTLTTETTREAKQFAFKGEPSYTEILKSGSVEVVTLANNHSSDYGAKSLADTKQYLSEAGIEYCMGDEIVLREVNGIQTAFIGIYVLNDGMARENQVKETIASAKARGAQLVITAFHWGSEKATQPDDTQQALAHLAIDCGADLVVGHHPHVLQGIENYNGKYIVYSLGNFCFGGNSSPSDTDTMIFRQTFKVGQDHVVSDQDVEIIPCKISSVEGYNNYQPMVAVGAEADRIVGRVNEYSEAYGQHFDASDGLN